MFDPIAELLTGGRCQIPPVVRQQPVEQRPADPVQHRVHADLTGQRSPQILQRAFHPDQQPVESLQFLQQNHAHRGDVDLVLLLDAPNFERFGQLFQDIHRYLVDELVTADATRFGTCDRGRTREVCELFVVESVSTLADQGVFIEWLL